MPSLPVSLGFYEYLAKTLLKTRSLIQIKGIILYVYMRNLGAVEQTEAFILHQHQVKVSFFPPIKYPTWSFLLPSRLTGHRQRLGVGDVVWHYYGWFCVRHRVSHG